jgi:hypothetical protein
VGLSSPDVPFTKIKGRITFLSEQFWGRAARASNDSRESDARFLFLETVIRSFADRRNGFDCDLGQYVEMVKFTVTRASVSTGCPPW